MLALIIIVLVLILLLMTPVGVRASYWDGELSVSATLGPFKLKLFPRKQEKAKETETKKKEKPKKEKPEKPKRKLTRQDILDIAKLGLKALSRFRRSLSIDRMTLHLTVASDDPYDTVMRYGYINAALCAMLPLFHNAFKIRSEDIGVEMSFETDKISADVLFAATLRIGEILRIALCAAAGFLVWLHKRKKRAAICARPETQKG